MNPAELHEYFRITSGVKTDSRLIKDDCLFFALKGHNFDGNEFAIEALKKDKLSDEVLGSVMKKSYLSYKNDEWERYHQAVTDWEVKEYLRLF